MDLKTKQLVDEAEARARLSSDTDEMFSRLAIAPDFSADVNKLVFAVREQDKRARHAEEERDLLSKRIDELEAQAKNSTNKLIAASEYAEEQAREIETLRARLIGFTNPISQATEPTIIVDEHGRVISSPETRSKIDALDRRIADLESRFDYAKCLASLTLTQKALITDEMKALAVSIIG